VNIVTFVLRGKFRNKIATEQQLPIRYAAIQQFTEIKKFNFTGLEVI